MEDNDFNGANPAKNPSTETDRGLIGDLEYRRQGNDAGGEGAEAIGEMGQTMSRGVDDFADKASETVTDLSEVAATAYEQAAWRVQKARDAVEPFVQDRPYAAMGIAAAVGVVVGMLMAGRKTKVIYIRQPH